MRREVLGSRWHALKRGFVLGGIKPLNHLRAEYGCRCRAAVQLLDQLAQSFRIVADIFFLEAHAA